MIKLAFPVAFIIVVGIYQLAGLSGLGVAVFMLVLFEYIHQKVYGKSISQIGD